MLGAASSLVVEWPRACLSATSVRLTVGASAHIPLPVHGFAGPGGLVRECIQNACLCLLDASSGAVLPCCGVSDF